MADDRTLHECELCARYNTRKAFSALLEHIVPHDGPSRHLMIEYVDMTVDMTQLP